MTNAQRVNMSDLTDAVARFVAGQGTEDDARLFEHMARCIRGYETATGGCEAHHHENLVNGEFPCPE